MSAARDKLKCYALDLSLLAVTEKKTFAKRKGLGMSMTNKKARLFTAKAGQVSTGAIQRSDKSEIISIWTYRLLTIKLLYGII